MREALLFPAVLFVFGVSPAGRAFKQLVREAMGR